MSRNHPVHTFVILMSADEFWMNLVPIRPLFYSVTFLLSGILKTVHPLSFFYFPLFVVVVFAYGVDITILERV